VLPDMRSHTGICMILIKGATCSRSYKQKLNTNSSTEAELIAIYDPDGGSYFVYESKKAREGQP